MGEFSLTHILIIALIFLIFFGPSRLPQLGQSLGKAIRGFKQGLSEIDVDAKDIHDNNATNTTQVAQKQNGGQLNGANSSQQTATPAASQATSQTETPEKQGNHQS
jgi:sec-independent protein translocase protein TatA